MHLRGYTNRPNNLRDSSPAKTIAIIHIKHIIIVSERMLNVQVEKLFGKKFHSMQRWTGHEQMWFAVKQITNWILKFDEWLLSFMNLMIDSWDFLLLLTLSVQQTKRFIHKFSGSIGSASMFYLFWPYVCRQCHRQIDIYAFFFVLSLSISLRISLEINYY